MVEQQDWRAQTFQKGTVKYYEIRDRLQLLEEISEPLSPHIVCLSI